MCKIIVTKNASNKINEMKKDSSEINSDQQIVWENITYKQLWSLVFDDNLSEHEITKMFDISKSEIYSKIEEFGFEKQLFLYKKFFSKDSETFCELNEISKEKFLNADFINELSKTLTVYIFRNGPVEDMHSNNQLSENDMKTLNIFITNKIAGLFTLALKEDWLKIDILLLHLLKLATRRHKKYACF